MPHWYSFSTEILSQCWESHRPLSVWASSCFLKGRKWSYQADGVGEGWKMGEKQEHLRRWTEGVLRGMTEWECGEIIAMEMPFSPGQRGQGCRVPGSIWFGQRDSHCSRVRMPWEERAQPRVRAKIWKQRAFKRQNYCSACRPFGVSRHSNPDWGQRQGQRGHAFFFLTKDLLKRLHISLNHRLSLDCENELSDCS